jgi:hypothetical protein
MNLGARHVDQRLRRACVVWFVLVAVFSGAGLADPGPHPTSRRDMQAGDTALKTVDPAVHEIRQLLTAAKYAEAEARARELLAIREKSQPSSIGVARALDVLVQAPPWMARPARSN